MIPATRYHGKYNADCACHQKRRNYPEFFARNNAPVQLLESEQPDIEQTAKGASQNANPQYNSKVISQRKGFENRQLKNGARPEKNPHDDIRHEGGNHRHREHDWGEVAVQFLDAKEHASQRRIESGGNAGSRACSDQETAIIGNVENVLDCGSRERTELDGWSLSAERKPRAKRKCAAGEFERELSFPVKIDAPQEKRFDLGNSGTFDEWRASHK